MPYIEGQPIDFFDITGGLDTVASAIKLGTTKLRDCQNINYFPVGGYSWRNGYTALNGSPSGSSVTGTYMARFSNGTNLALRVCGDKLEKMDSLDGTWDDITNGTTITAADTNTWMFGILNDVVVMANDTDTCLQTNASGTTAALAGSPAFTSALFLFEYRGYMFYGNTVESATRQPDRLRFSDINAPNAFTMLGSNNYIDVAKKQGGDLRGGTEFKGDAYLFKRHGIYQLTYSPTRVNSSGTLFPFLENPNPVVPGVGTQSPRSIVKFTTPITNQLEAGTEFVFFVDQHGIPCLFDGRSAVRVGYPISDSRDSTIKSLSDMDRSKLATVWAVNYPDRNQILVFMPSTSAASGKHDTCWVLDYSVGFAWGRHKFADTFCSGALYEKTDGTFCVYFSDYAGTTYQYDTGTSDNGVAIASYARHGDAFLGSFIQKCNWPWMEIRGATGDTSEDVKVDFYIDGQDASSKQVSITLADSQATWDDVNWDEFNWAGSGLVTRHKEIGVDAKTLSVKISNSTLDNTATIEGFSLMARPQGYSQV